MKKEKKAKRGRPNNRAVTVILVVILVIGLSVLLYPTISNWWNERTQSYAVAEYNEVVSQMTEEEYEAYFEAANEYNEALYNLGSYTAFAKPELVEGYDETLNITADGMMGYITIEKLSINLPIYHGTSDRVLNSAAGHLEGSSLPVGGGNTHAVLSAHRGLPTARLFTDIDKLEIGDTFTITVLQEVFTYQVDQIITVLPEEMENLYIADGEDYCTLLTCTPYGVNTHRLLVRGVRVENREGDYVNANYSVSPWIIALIIVLFIILIILIAWLIYDTRRRKRQNAVQEGGAGPEGRTGQEKVKNGKAPPGKR